MCYILEIRDMNWYKKAQSGYGEIGHSWSQDGDVDSDEYPNYLWIFIDGKVVSEIEYEGTADHTGLFEMTGEQLDRIYRGRFDSYSGILSLLKPMDGVLAFRDEPKSLRSKLHSAFPEAERIEEF